MFKKLLLLLFTFTNAGIIFLMLCLGSQNLNDRQKLNLGFSTSSPFPTGFLIGVSITLGYISGGSSFALLLPTNNPNNEERTY